MAFFLLPSKNKFAFVNYFTYLCSIILKLKLIKMENLTIINHYKLLVQIIKYKEVIKNALEEYNKDIDTFNNRDTYHHYLDLLRLAKQELPSIYVEASDALDHVPYFDVKHDIKEISNVEDRRDEDIPKWIIKGILKNEEVFSLVIWTNTHAWDIYYIKPDGKIYR